MRLFHTLTLAASLLLLGACGRMEISDPLQTPLDGVSLDSLSHPSLLFVGRSGSSCQENLFTAHLSNASDSARSLVLRASLPGYSDIVTWNLTLPPRSDTALPLYPTLRDTMPRHSTLLPMRLEVYDLYGSLYATFLDTLPYADSEVYVPACAPAPSLPTLSLPAGYLGYSAPPYARIASVALSNLVFPADDELPDTWLEVTAPTGQVYSSSLRLNDSSSSQVFSFATSPLPQQSGAYQAVLFERDPNAEIPLDTLLFTLDDSLKSSRPAALPLGSMTLQLDWYYPADQQAQQIFLSYVFPMRQILPDSLLNWTSQGHTYAGIHIRPLLTIENDTSLTATEMALLFASALKTAGLRPLVLLTASTPVVGWYIDSTCSAANFLDLSALHGSGFTEANQLGVSRYLSERGLPTSRLLEFK